VLGVDAEDKKICSDAVTLGRNGTIPNFCFHGSDILQKHDHCIYGKNPF
jgi:hypothetical protein